MKFCPNPVALLGASSLFCPLTPSTCCMALLNSTLAPYTVLPSSTRFPALVGVHYSVLAQLRPSCFVLPETTHQVSQAIAILSNVDDGSPQCQIAVRSGGHTPWPGAANIRGGVTIDLSMMNATLYHEETSTVLIGAGARWGSVYRALKPYGMAVTGGRADSVGVGGLVTGGGMSFFTAQQGLVCDNVLDFEVVLANGTVAHASASSHPDLYRVLKGGSNNFGIVTHIVLSAFPQGDLWGGVVQHRADTTSLLISALVNFTDRVADDPRASLVSIWQYSPIHGTGIASGIQYTDPTVAPGIFGELLSIPQVSNTTRFADIYDLMMETAPPPGKRILFDTLTVKNDPRVPEMTTEVQQDYIKSITRNSRSQDYDIISFWQPLPQIFGERSRKNGGNLLGLERLDGNHLLYLLFLSWENEADDDLFHRVAHGIIHEIRQYAAKIAANSDFIYLNYAGSEQRPFDGYGQENRRAMRAAIRAYDPTGFFQTRLAGGFKAGNG